MFSKPLCIVNISSYEKEQLKLRRPILGVKGGWGQKHLSKQPSLQHLAVTLKIIMVGQILVKITTNSTNTIRKCTSTLSNSFLNLYFFFWGGAKIIPRGPQ